MNIILYFTILFLFLLFSFLFIYNEWNECFTQNYDYDYRFTHTCKNTLNPDCVHGYNQMYEFIPDKYNYDFSKDSGVLKSIKEKSIKIKKGLTLGKIEFYNLKRKIEEKDKLPPIDKTKPNEFVNNKTLPPYPLIQKELELLDINNILIGVEYEYGYNPENYTLKLMDQGIDNVKYSYSYDLIKKWLAKIITTEANKPLYRYGDYDKDFDNTHFKYMNDNILSYKIDINKKIEEFKFQMRLYRDNKQHNFIVYFEILFNYETTDYFIKNIILLGIDFEENIQFNTYKQNKFNELDKNGCHLSMKNISDNELLNRNKHINKFVENNQKKEIYDYDRHRCFKKEAIDKNNCISPNNKDITIGVWDEPCVYDEDCPYYRKNLNYPNKRGRCINSYCEMPLNVERVGYKKMDYSINNKPLCYNCKRIEGCEGMACNMCCEEQKDRENYPLLKSPDYIFENDFNDRVKHSKEIKQQGIQPIRLLA